MPWPKTCATHYLTQLGLLDKGRAIKEFVVYSLSITQYPGRLMFGILGPGFRIRIDCMRIRILQIWSVRIRPDPDP